MTVLRMSANRTQIKYSETPRETLPGPSLAGDDPEAMAAAACPWSGRIRSAGAMFEQR